MGLWDTIKTAAVKAKCGIGAHGGNFKTPDGKPECYYEKTCPDCKKLITKSNHKHEVEWRDAPYDSNSSIKCTKVQKCIHCDAIEKRVIHEEYRKLGTDARCQTIMACTRCGEEKTGEYDHAFMRDGIEDGKIVMKCMNCGRKEHRKFA